MTRMRFIPALFLALLGSLRSCVNAAVSTSTLQVHIPPSMSKEGGYQHSDALFGIPPYGGSIQAQVYYSDDDFCGPMDKIDSRGGYPARSDGKPWEAPFILMINRGECPFVTKVRTAQKLGAAGVLVADWQCVCGAPDCPAEPCQQTEPIMADDGSGLDISIPSFLVTKNDADEIKETLTAGTPVRVEMAFSIPAPDSRVEYSLWFRPRDAQTNAFLKAFRKAAVALGKDAYFTPHYYIYDGIKAGCLLHGQNQCTDYCTNEGRYCSSNADVVFGVELVKENLRRDCIWKEYGQEDGVGLEWWDYVLSFVEKCDVFHKPELFTSDDCGLSAMQEAGVDPAQIQKCMVESGDLNANVTNPLLEAEVKARQDAGALLIPAVHVNNAPVRGELEFATIFKAVCAGYATGYEPPICQACANCIDEDGCVEHGGKCSRSSGMSVTGGGDVSAQTFVASLVGVTLFLSCIGFLQYRRQQQHMRAQVRGILAEYMPLDVNQKPQDTSVALPEEGGTELT